MGFFSNLFGGGAKQEDPDPQVRAIRHYIDEKLPKSYVSSKKYDVKIQQKDGSYTAQITLDMKADGSDYSTFVTEDYFGLADMESSYLFDTFLSDPPVPVFIIFHMVFDPKTRITVDKGKTPVG